MTIQHQCHKERIDSGLGFEWDLLPPWVTSIANVDPNTSDLRLRRQKTGYRGVGQLGNLKRLFAYGVNQAFLDEIALLEQLEVLSIQKMTAANLQPLSQLKSLRILIIADAAMMENVEWATSLHGVKGLALEGCSKVNDLAPLSGLRQLVALSVEGGMWTPMRVASLEPLRGLIELEYLFMTNLRVEDKSLEPLTNLKQLKAIQCAKFFAEEEFAALQAALPGTRCDWFAAGK